MIQKTLALLVGVVLLAVGVIGFITGDMILMFGINMLHSIIHVVSGLLGIAMSFSFAKAFNRGFGIIYLLVGILGFVAPAFMLSLLNVNMADNFLHIGIGVVLTGVGFAVSD